MKLCPHDTRNKNCGNCGDAKCGYAKKTDTWNCKKWVSEKKEKENGKD